MDMHLNRIPPQVESIHLTAVCGTGMGALAGMLKDLGHRVTGSDQGVYPPMSHFLAAKGIPVTEGFSPENLAHRPDLVVVGNAVTRTNPEAVAIAETGIPFCSMPQAVNHFIVRDRAVLMAVGTHGKTTTASILAWILHHAGLDPSFFIGGIVRDFQSNYRLGKGPYVVIEGDEYDTAFFDKGPKFLHYDPKVAILTSVEFDHADIFRDLAQIREAFDRLIEGMAPDSTLIPYDGDETVAGLIQGRRCRIVPYGSRPESPWRLGETTAAAPWTRFEILKEGRPFGAFRTRLMGRHNLGNILACIAAADGIGVSPAAMAAALESFQGPRRRQEIRGVKRGVTVIDDFAHHPTAVRETLLAVRSFYPRERLVAVFEPRTNTSMRRVFQEVYPRVFDGADRVLIRKPSRLDKVPEAERFSSEGLVEDLRRRGLDARHFDDTDAVIRFLAGTSEAGDVVLIMSNGGFDNIHERLLEAL